MSVRLQEDVCMSVRLQSVVPFESGVPTFPPVQGAISKEKKIMLYNDINSVYITIGEAAKKMAGPLRPNSPPPPSSLMAVGTLERWNVGKKRLKKNP